MSFTVIVPTHDHAETLIHSVGSVLNQTWRDFEIVIVGDGSPPRTHEIAAELAARDRRVRFLPFPKGERHGEAHRHHVLNGLTTDFVAYLADDDLWFPNHLESLAPLLERFDIAHTMFMEFNPDGGVFTGVFDAAVEPDGVARLGRFEAGFGLASGAHRLDSYRRLPKGWHPAPRDVPSDVYFWLQFVEQPWCRYVSYKWPTGLHLSSVTRRGWPREQRLAELEKAAAIVADPERRLALIQSGLQPLLHRMHVEVSRGRQGRAEAAARLSGEEGRHGLPAYALGQALSFADGGDAHAFPNQGFFPAEEWGAWTSTDPAVIVLPVPDGVSGNLLATVTARHLVERRKRPLARFSVTANALPVFEGAERKPGPFTYSFTIPEPVWRRQGYIAFRFSAPLETPVRLGLGPDYRRLGIGMIMLRMELARDEQAF
ncbi:MAG TPA: glycosyltransferase family 2 protein [Bauldia sp.]|nr:glycosyltransferase family 2 protein [Bauldia sp.]